MSALAAHAPEALAFMSAKMSVGAPCSRPCAGFRDGGLLDEAATRFAGAHQRPDPRALVSLWSQYYFAALIIPTTVAALRLDRVLPVAIDDLALDLEDDGQIARFGLLNEGHARGGDRFGTLVRNHLEPFIACCAAHCRLSPRVLWANAATILDHAVGECARAGGCGTAALAEAEALLMDPGSPLSGALLVTPDGGRRRRVCCLRSRLAGVASCGALCPLEGGCDTARHLRTGTALS